MKIAIICHFSNNEIQDLIKPIKRVKEFAPWITYYINEFKKYPEEEIFIISPHEWLTKDVKFKIANVNFYFFRRGIPFIGRHWPSIFDFDFITRYWLNKYKVRKYINSIKPDVINLIGAENPYYSSTIMQFKSKYPVLLTVQGFAGRGRLDFNVTKYWQYRLNLEKEVIKSFNNFCIRTDEMWKYIKGVNPTAIAHRFTFPTFYENIKSKKQEKKYDFVFFARVTKDKGIYDYIEAIRDIKKEKYNIKAMVIGPCSKSIREDIQKFSIENDLLDNIDHIGFIPTQLELFEKVKSARISVLPTYNDLISGTIIESMFLGLPVVAYKTGSIPEVNSERENIIICEQGDKKGLTKEMLRVLYNSDLQSTLSQHANEWVRNRFDNKKAMKGYLTALRKIVNDN